MKYEERLLNDAEIGDRVYGYDNESDLIKAICNLLTRALDGLI